MNEVRYALFYEGENIYTDQRTFKSKSYAKAKKDDFIAVWAMCNKQCHIEIKEVPVDIEEIETIKAKCLKLKQLILLTDPVVGDVVMNDVSMRQWNEFIKCFPDEGSL